MGLQAASKTHIDEQINRILIHIRNIYIKTCYLKTVSVGTEKQMKEP